MALWCGDGSGNDAAIVAGKQEADTSDESKDFFSFFLFCFFTFLDLDGFFVWKFSLQTREVL